MATPRQVVAVRAPPDACIVTLDAAHHVLGEPLCLPAGCVTHAPLAIGLFDTRLRTCVAIVQVDALDALVPDPHMGWRIAYPADYRVVWPVAAPVVHDAALSWAYAPDYRPTFESATRAALEQWTRTYAKLLCDAADPTVDRLGDVLDADARQVLLRATAAHMAHEPRSAQDFWLLLEERLVQLAAAHERDATPASVRLVDWLLTAPAAGTYKPQQPRRVIAQHVEPALHAHHLRQILTTLRGRAAFRWPNYPAFGRDLQSLLHAALDARAAAGHRLAQPHITRPLPDIEELVHVLPPCFRPAWHHRKQRDAGRMLWADLLHHLGYLELADEARLTRIRETVTGSRKAADDLTAALRAASADTYRYRFTCDYVRGANHTHAKQKVCCPHASTATCALAAGHARAHRTPAQFVLAALGQDF